MLLLLVVVLVLVLVLPVLVGPGAAKLEQHARPRRGGRGRRDSVNSRSPRDRGGGEYSGSDHRFSPILPSSLLLPSSIITTIPPSNAPLLATWLFTRP